MNYRLSALATMIACSVQPVAHAQDADLDSFFERNRNLSVDQRLNQNFPNREIQLGSFNVFPSVTLGLESNDNVFASQNAEDSDIIATFNPRLSLASIWSRHAISADASATRHEYFDFSDESVWNYRLAADGRLDVSYRTQLTGDLSYDARTEPRTGAGVAANALEPVEFDIFSSALGAEHVTGRIRLSGEVAIESFDYDDAFLSSSVLADQDFRDYDKTELAVRGDVALSPDSAVFVRTIWNEREYATNPVPALQRDSSGYTVEVGTDFDIRGVARGVVAIGYTEQDYDSATFPTIDGVNIDGQLDWFPTQLTTISFTGSRTVKESAIPGSGGFFSSDYSVEFNHELRRHIILSAGVGFSEDDYANIDRVDERTSYSVGATYMVARNIGIEAQFVRQDQDSTGLAGNQDFTVNKFGLSLVIRR